MIYLGSPLANKGSQNRSKPMHTRYTHSRQLLPFLYLILIYSNLQPIVIAIVDRRDSQEFGTAVGHEVDNRPTFFLGFGSGNAPEKERDSANGPATKSTVPPTVVSPGLAVPTPLPATLK